MAPELLHLRVVTSQRHPLRPHGGKGERGGERCRAGTCGDRPTAVTEPEPGKQNASLGAGQLLDKGHRRALGLRSPGICSRTPSIRQSRSRTALPWVYSCSPTLTLMVYDEVIGTYGTY